MSNLRNTLLKLAEEYVDPSTGEILNSPPENVENQGWEDKMRNIMYDTKKRAQDDYRDAKYYNQWNKVSPFNILINDNINDLYVMDPKSAANAVVNIIEQLNTTYGDDTTYDYVSQSYLNEIKMNMEKKRTIDQVIQYLTNIYFKGMGMGSTTRKRAGIEEDYEDDTIAVNIKNKNSIHLAILALAAYSKLKK